MYAHALVALCAAAEPPDPFVTVEERARLELQPDRTGFEATRFADGLVGNRARLGVGLVRGGLSVFAQVQDVRRWGSEHDPGTGGQGTVADFDADGLDLHQGWGRLTSGAAELTVGRQEIVWFDERLIGSLGWAHQGRSFDAVRLRLRSGAVRGEVLGSVLVDRPNAALPDAAPREDTVLVGGTAGHAGERHGLDLLAIGVLDRVPGQRTGTSGVIGTIRTDVAAGSVSAYGQVGVRDGQGVLAGLVAASADTAGLIAPLTVGAGADLSSGDARPRDGRDHRFDTLFGTNHKFYGHMDYFLDLLVHTGGRGLVDLYVTADVSGGERGGVTVGGHHFRAAAGSDAPALGTEMDLDGVLALVPGASLGGGGGLFFPAAPYGGAPAPFVYLQLLTALDSRR